MQQFEKLLGLAIFLLNWSPLFFLLGQEAIRAQNPGSACAYGIYAKQGGDIPIDKVCIFGERCSGTNYLQQLIPANFPDLSWQQTYGWKHFPAWLSAAGSLNPGPSQFYTFEKSDSYLFIVIFRHPYDWIRSLSECPYHAMPYFINLPLDVFLRSQWICDPVDSFIHAMDKDPETGNYFTNVLKMRTAKILNMLMIKERVKNIYYLNYETVRDYPERIIEEIARIFKLEKTEKLILIPNYCDPRHDSQVKFEKIDPFIPPADLLLFIKSQLDLDLERFIGYKIEGN